MGKSIYLPCSIGEKVNIIIDTVDIPYIKEDVVIAFEIWNKNNERTLFIRTNWGLFEYNEKVFIKKEKAERKLNKGAKI